MQEARAGEEGRFSAPKGFAIASQHLLDSPEATRTWAERLARTLAPNSVLALYGDLGAGKTTFLQGLLRGLGGEESIVQSPTFTYLHHYPATLPLYHFDLYRLRSAHDFLAMGFQEVFEQSGVTAIEWPERISELLDFPHLAIRLSHVSENSRSLELAWN